MFLPPPLATRVSADYGLIVSVASGAIWNVTLDTRTVYEHSKTRHNKEHA